MTPVPGSHDPVVQGAPGGIGVGAYEMVPVPGSQDPVMQGSEAIAIGDPGMHVPSPSQVLGPLHGPVVPQVDPAVTGVETHRPTSHALVVHGLVPGHSESLEHSCIAASGDEASGSPSVDDGPGTGKAVRPHADPEAATVKASSATAMTPLRPRRGSGRTRRAYPFVPAPAPIQIGPDLDAAKRTVPHQRIRGNRPR
jgi:hypothetical protein